MGDGSKLKYDFLDTNPVQSKRYYQLKITEKNSAVVYSKILMVEELAGTASWLTLAPNPMEDLANIIVYSERNEQVQIDVFSMEGRKLLLMEKELIKGKNVFSIDFSNYPSGMYLLHAFSQGGQKAVLKVLKK